MRTGPPDDSTETPLPQCPRAVAFGMDAESLAELRVALPGWRIVCFHAATVGSMPRDWDPGDVDLFVVCLRENVTEALGLCRFLTTWPASESDQQQDRPENTRPNGAHEVEPGRSDVPLLVLVSSGQDTLVGAALEAGARLGLSLPISAKELAGLLVGLQIVDPPIP